MNGKLFFGVLFILFLTGCGSHKKVRSQKQKAIYQGNKRELPLVRQSQHVKKLERLNPSFNKHTLQYIGKYAPLAVAEMFENRIPASITLAQGILESASGRSQLALKSNNHFGIKCHKGWEGEKVFYHDDIKDECFRKYQHVYSSYRDHSEFLTRRKRYADLFKLRQSDYKGWAKGLKKLGYATDRDYSKKLVRIIEEYRLYEFDQLNNKEFKNSEPAPGTSLVKVKTLPDTSTSKYYTVKKGDTLYSIAKKFKISVAFLKEKNKLENNILSIDQELIVK